MVFGKHIKSELLFLKRYRWGFYTANLNGEGLYEGKSRTHAFFFFWSLFHLLPSVSSLCMDLVPSAMSGFIAHSLRRRWSFWNLMSRTQNLGSTPLLCIRIGRIESFLSSSLHDCRLAHSPKNYIQDQMIDDTMHLVIWGHEHECLVRDSGRVCVNHGYLDDTSRESSRLPYPTAWQLRGDVFERVRNSKEVLVVSLTCV